VVTWPTGRRRTLSGVARSENYGEFTLLWVSKVLCDCSLLDDYSLTMPPDANGVGLVLPFLNGELLPILLGERIGERNLGERSISFMGERERDFGDVSVGFLGVSPRLSPSCNAFLLVLI